MTRILTHTQYQNTSGVPLNTFLNSLFDPWPGPFGTGTGLFRAALLTEIKRVEVAQKSVPNGCWLIDADTIQRIKTILRGYWHGGTFRPNPLPRVIDSDKAIIGFISKYINDNNLVMHVPEFVCHKKNESTPSVYRITSYRTIPFKEDGKWWFADGIDEFLELFLLGGHFVVIHSDKDLPEAGPNFFNIFKQIDGVSNAGHSHYTGHMVSLFGKNFPPLTLNDEEGDDLDSITDPATASLLPVVLCDETSNSSPNSFFQMEGWPPGKNMFGLRALYRNKALAGGYRHGADFKTHSDTIWNISTYGACPFSEKRSGTIFLAPEKWFALDMPIYRGFGGKNEDHAWFKKELTK